MSKPVREVQDGSMLPCSFYLHYTYNLSAIAVPHRDDTDIIMPLNMETLYDKLVALQVKYNGRLCQPIADFLIVVYCNIDSTMHHFHIIRHFVSFSYKRK